MTPAFMFFCQNAIKMTRHNTGKRSLSKLVSGKSTSLKYVMPPGQNMNDKILPPFRKIGLMSVILQHTRIQNVSCSDMNCFYIFIF